MPHSADAQVRTGGGRRRWSAVAIALGLALLAAAAGQMWMQRTVTPVYHYELGATVAEADLGPLAAFAQPQVSVRHAVVRSSDDAKPLAELEIAESARGPVLLNWRARVDDPFLTLTAPPEDVTALAEVLKRHVAKDRTLLAWWDVSRQFQLLSDVDVVFAQHLGLPLFVPAHWRAQQAGVEAIEQVFWRGTADDVGSEQLQRFRSFAHALVAPEQQGIAALQALAGGKTAVLVLHLRDLILLGQMVPEQLGVAFQDFGVMTDVHGMVRRVHAWLDQHKYPVYGVLQAKGQPTRAVALTDTASGKTLAARLLPLMGNDQQDVAGATLVYRVGGFSVFEIAPTAPAAQTSGAPGAAS